MMPALRYATILFIAAFLGSAAFAKVIVPPEPGNRLSVTATVTVEKSDGLYTYRYSFTNAATSKQRAEFIIIELQGKAIISNVESPRGWTQSTLFGDNIIAWQATEIYPLPANFVDTGGLVPSPYQIAAGKTLSGFSFQSAAPPTSVKFYAQGFTQIPAADDADDFGAEGYTLPDTDFRKNSFIGSTKGPDLSTPPSPTIR